MCWAKLIVQLYEHGGISVTATTRKGVAAVTGYSRRLNTSGILRWRYRRACALRVRAYLDKWETNYFMNTLSLLHTKVQRFSQSKYNTLPTHLNFSPSLVVEKQNQL